MFRKLAVAALVAFAISPSVGSAQIYSNGGPNDINGWSISGIERADNFVLANDYTITGIRFWGSSFEQPSPYVGSIAWRIYDNVGGVPGSVLVSGISSPVPIDQGLQPSQRYQYQFDFATSFGLTAGTYWLGVHNGQYDETPNGVLYWRSSDNNATTRSMRLRSSGWVEEEDELAFEVYGEPVGTSVVPEPSTYAMFAIGLVGIGVVRRRRRLN
jgi:hypothetical protein